MLLMIKEIKILICEDESIIAMDLKNSLVRLGYIVTAIVKTGDELLRKFNETNPDIIISDIRLHGNSTSISALEIISKQSNIPVIFISGLVNAKTVTSGYAINPCFHLPKPYNIEKLRQTIELCCSGKEI